MKANEMNRHRTRGTEGGHDDVQGWKRDRRKQRRFKRTVLLLCLPALLASSACAGSSGAGQGEGRQGGSNGAAQGGKDEQEAFLKFAQCMREQGVDMPDPEFKGSGQVAAVRIGGPDVSPEEMQEAQNACRKHLPQSASGDAPKLSEEDQDAFLAFARCMREQGINHPDPRPGDGGLTVRVGDPNAPDPESPEYKEAEKACRKHLAPIDRKMNRERA